MLRKSVLSNFAFSSILPVRKPLPSGLYGTKPMPSSSKRRYHFLLRRPRPQRVFALESSDRLDGVCATDGLHACFGKAEVLDLAFLNQVLHRSGYVFDGHVRVNAMLIEQVDDIHLEPLERALDGLLDVLRPAVQARQPFMPRGSRSGLRSNPNLVAITTCSRKGASASPTSSSFENGP